MRTLRTVWKRAITHSFARFLSIFFLVLLGVAFLAGIRATEPDMRVTVDEQYDKKNFMDIRILSTQGLTDGDIQAVKKVKGVQTVEPVHTKDVLCDINDQEMAIKIYQQPKSVNKLYLNEGRDIKKSGECLLDQRFAEEYKVKIGDVITVKSGDDGSIKDSLKRESYRVVGFVDSNQYLNRDRGTTTIGSGKLSGFLVISEQDFAMDVYTEFYVTVKGAKKLTTYTDAYEDQVEKIVKGIEKISGQRETIRYEEIVMDAKEELAKNETKYKKEKKKAEKKLQDAKKQLDKGKEEIEQGEQKLKTSKEQLDKGKKELSSGKKQYQSGKKQLEEGKTQYQKGYEQYQEGEKSYRKQKVKLEKAKESLEQALQQYGISYDQLNEQYGELYTQYQQYLAGEKQLEQARAKLDQTKRTLSASKKKLQSSKQQLTVAKRKLDQAEQKLKEGQAQYEQGKKKIEDAKKQYQTGLASYKKNKKKADKKFREAKQKLDDAKEEIQKIKKGSWYILDRNKIQSYVEYGQESERIGAIGKVFPLLFFLVAALVSLTTMTRMVEEERVQMGTMKALGYSKLQIAGKYLIYAAAATVLGSIAGILLGEYLLPSIIITAYGMMYVGVKTVATPIHMDLGLLAAGAAFLTTFAATLFACYRDLLEAPAQLMRPEAPKEGKRVLLEKIPFLWKRISFSWKSSIRNLFRYKKRLFMTIFGISGCMALLLVGFGLEDSIAAITENQYQKIAVYDASIGVDGDTKEETKQAIQKVLEQTEVVKGLRARTTSVDVEYQNKSKTAYFIVPEDKEKIEEFIHFKDRVTGEKYHLDENGVILTEKAATMLGVEVGDTVILKEGDTKKVKAKVSAISENYLMHYVFMSKELYQTLYGQKLEYSQVYCKMTKHGTKFEESFSKQMLKQDGVQSVTYVSTAEDEMADMLANLDIVIWVLIISAGLLAFVVLYNLNNINIEERRRELATMKVLGFYQSEMAAYVYRENILLTIFGIIVGMGLGALLHRYVILTAEVDAIMFGRIIGWKSYGYSILLTMLFSVFVNGIMYLKLKKINMVESLKSVD